MSLSIRRASASYPSFFTSLIEHALVIAIVGVGAIAGFKEFQKPVGRPFCRAAGELSGFASSAVSTQWWTFSPRDQECILDNEGEDGDF